MRTMNVSVHSLGDLQEAFRRGSLGELGSDVHELSSGSDHRIPQSGGRLRVGDIRVVVAFLEGRLSRAVLGRSCCFVLAMVSFLWSVEGSLVLLGAVHELLAQDAAQGSAARLGGHGKDVGKDHVGDLVE